MTESEIQNIIL